MEKLDGDPQIIAEQEHDHVGIIRQIGTISMSADSRRASWRGGVRVRPLDPSSDILSGRPSTPRASESRVYHPRWRGILGGGFGTLGYLLVLLASLWINTASAAFVEFQNCLSDSYLHDTPRKLQFVPLFLDATFDTTNPKHELRVTVWGNVTGSGPDTLVTLPSGNDTDYWDSNSTDTDNGKIVEIPPDPGNKITTLFNKVNVLTYEPWNETVNFCDRLVNGTCPLGPTFNVNRSDPYNFPSIGLQNNFYSTYAFTSFTTTLIIKYGDADATDIGCISADITPDLGSSLSGILTFLPLVVLIFVGIATAFAGVYSPWGTTDTFRWTTNYGRDADLLRLVTPGFGDCLQYLQFIALTGGLSLNYPGYYQPVVSKVSWSALMFNESFVSHGPQHQSLTDGIYVTHGTYGLDILRQLVGMGAVDDVWAGMTVWLLVIIAIVLAIIQIGFLLRWAFRHINHTHEEDLRAKNMPFSMGNVIRIVFNYFLLPIVALSMFQLVEATKSPSSTVGLAALMLLLIVVFAVWLLYLIASTRPKSFLFDDLSTVVLYGSLYNTYSDHAAPFALVPVLLTFVRGIAIGAIQPSGIAQLIVLAICEVITVLTLHAFRPFHSPTSMNAYHTFFAALRFATLLLMIAFAPSLGVTEGPKGWIGYTILLMHAIVLVLGFLLNAIQTIIEVAARLAGAGGDASGAARGGLVKVFGVRQLSRRLPRRDAAASRQSQLSSAAMLADTEMDRKSYTLDGNRMRSQSAGSTGILLNRQSTGLDSIGSEAFGALPVHQGGNGTSSHTPTTPGEPSTFALLPFAAAAAGSGVARQKGPPMLGISTADAADPYYRPPRARRPTLDAYSSSRNRESWASRDGANKRWSENDPASPDNNTEPFEGPSISGRATPAPQQNLDGNPNDPMRSQADYTTREVDFYYGVRGPALNANVPSRRIKTGPSDPTGIPASAAGWFKGLFGGKTKEKGKGFEVVRSSRMPPGMAARSTPGGEETPPEGIPVATGGIRNGPIDSDDEEEGRARLSNVGPSNAAAVDGTREDDNLVSPLGSEDEVSGDDDEFETTRISDIPPSLPGLDLSEGGIELPSRFPSKASSKPSKRAITLDYASVPSRVPSRKPSVPRKSSKRHSQNVSVDLSQDNLPRDTLDVSRLPFEDSNSGKAHSTTSTKSSMGAEESKNNSSALGRLSADVKHDLPKSVGYVHHHNIHTVNPSDNPRFQGSSAEVVNE
ncbi:hypothetical protein B7494_g3658 [Chlorociboria aeruginascens]|nr:hypothetical protein B7494_g3658 [Chlorociboria aeruginascens]